MTLPVLEYRYYAFVTKIKDGDTYEVTVDVGFRIYADMPLRLAHVDTPEKDTQAGQVALQEVTTLLGPLPARVVVQTYKPIDKYGRYLATVLVDGEPPYDLAQNLIDNGYGKPYEGGKKSGAPKAGQAAPEASADRTRLPS